MTVFNGTWFDAKDPKDPAQGKFSIDPKGISTPPGQVAGVPGFNVDNLFYPNIDATGGGITPPPYFDNWGIAILMSGNIEGNIWGNGAGSYTVFEGSGDNAVGSATVTYVPEYSGLSMLLLSALTLAGVFVFKARKSGILPNF